MPSPDPKEVVKLSMYDCEPSAKSCNSPSMGACMVIQLQGGWVRHAEHLGSMSQLEEEFTGRCSQRLMGRLPDGIHKVVSQICGPLLVPVLWLL